MTGHMLAVECGGPGAVGAAPVLPDNLCGGAEVPDRTCSVDGCLEPLRARGLCAHHYYVAQRDGTLLEHETERLNGLPVATRLMRRRRITEAGCWEWTGYCTPDGYGRIRIGAQMASVHRVAWETLQGPIPEGLVIDHLCRNTRCFNPQHLEPVTLRENGLRGVGPIAVNARKTHCVNGHEFTAENTYYWTTRNGTTTRSCRACNRAAQARRWRRR